VKNHGEFDWKNYRPPGCTCEFPWNVCDACKHLRRESPSTIMRTRTALSNSAQDLLDGAAKAFSTRDLVALGQNVWELIKAREEELIGTTRIIGKDIQVILHKLSGATIPEAIWRVIRPHTRS